MESADPEVANRSEWLERKVLRHGVWFRGVRYDSDKLMKLRQRRFPSTVAVKLDKPDAGAILVREPRSKSILSVPAVSPLARRASKENSS